MPPMNPNKFVAIKAGTRPYRSAISPNRSPPTIAPQKNIDCANVGNAALSQTHSNCKESEKKSLCKAKIIIYSQESQVYLS